MDHCCFLEVWDCFLAAILLLPRRRNTRPVQQAVSFLYHPNCTPVEDPGYQTVPSLGQRTQTAGNHSVVVDVLVDRLVQMAPLVLD